MAASWSESCPLEGRCSECGLRFEWRAVFAPPRTVPSGIAGPTAPGALVLILVGVLGLGLLAFIRWLVIHI